MQLVNSTDILFSLATLTLLEIVLGVDNLVFISVVSSRLPQHQQSKARKVGLTLAWVTRLLLLFCAVWLSKLTKALFTVAGFAVSIRDVFMIAGGMFLLVKATQEIHNELETDHDKQENGKPLSFTNVIMQIMFLDVIFSFDSVITAIGLTQRFWIMATSITIAIIVMIVASDPLANFINRHPTVRMLAFSFLILIGTVLVADGIHFHIPRGYIYFSICFSILVEWLNSVKRKSSKKEQVS